MKKYLKKAFILLGAIISIFAVQGTVYAGTDTTAPVVTKATVKTLSVKKNENIRLDLAVVENDTGIAEIKVGLYCYKSTSASPLLIFGDADYTGEDRTSQYTGTITLDIPVASSDASGKYYIGFIKITDNAGNVNTYFEHYDENGYYTVNGASYLPLLDQTDVKEACLITNGACVTVISDGDDTAPIITNVSFASTKVSKTESIVANMTVIEESDISDVDLTYEGYKNKQRIMISYWPISWSRSKNSIKAPMKLSDEDMAGTYYLSQV